MEAYTRDGLSWWVRPYHNKVVVTRYDLVTQIRVIDELNPVDAFDLAMAILRTVRAVDPLLLHNEDAVEDPVAPEVKSETPETYVWPDK